MYSSGRKQCHTSSSWVEEGGEIFQYASELVRFVGESVQLFFPSSLFSLRGRQSGATQKLNSNIFCSNTSNTVGVRCKNCLLRSVVGGDKQLLSNSNSSLP